jgi:circadian clock protein KaiC
VHKALSVVKKRTGRHETSIREFGVYDSRLKVGAPLTQFRGVLSGVPEYVGEPLAAPSQRAASVRRKKA